MPSTPRGFRPGFDLRSAEAVLSAMPPDPVYVDGAPQWPTPSGRPPAPPVDGQPVGAIRDPLAPQEAREFVLEGMGLALGLKVLRAHEVPRGTCYLIRPDRFTSATAIVVGTKVDPLEAVRREARRIVQDGIRAAGLMPRAYCYKVDKQREAEALVDELAGDLK